MASRVETVAFPWERVRHSVVVYISLGTLFNTDAAFYRTCFDAFQGETFQVIMSVGANAPAGITASAPANFIVQDYVPQLDVLRRARAFVTHGGMNSVSESLYYGVPVVVIPQMSEQAIVGRRVEELGAGLFLAKDSAAAGALRESVGRLLAEDRFGRRAAEVRESFQTAGGVTRAADAIQAFTRHQRLQLAGSATHS
jgi:MGT family glycosyltransferase